MKDQIVSWPESLHRVRFKDCDPLGHLYNTRFLEYMLEAREDQIFSQYELDLSQYAEERGMSWVIVRHEIAYLKEAKRNEFVCIRSAIIDFDDKSLHVEYQMWDRDKNVLKAIMWTHFLHVNFLTKKVCPHPADMMDMMTKVCVHKKGQSLDERIQQIKSIGKEA